MSTFRLLTSEHAAGVGHSNQAPRLTAKRAATPRRRCRARAISRRPKTKDNTDIAAAPPAVASPPQSSRFLSFTRALSFARALPGFTSLRVGERGHRGVSTAVGVVPPRPFPTLRLKVAARKVDAGLASISLAGVFLCSSMYASSQPFVPVGVEKLQWGTRCRRDNNNLWCEPEGEDDPATFRRAVLSRRCPPGTTART